MKKRYHSFAEYLQENHYKDFCRIVATFIWENRHIFFKSESEKKTWTNLDLKIDAVSFQSVGEGNYITFHVKIDAVIWLLLYHENHEELTKRNVLLSATCSAILKNGLFGMQISDVEKYDNASFKSASDYSEYLVPILHKEQLDDVAEEFLRKYAPAVLTDDAPLDIKQTIRNMCLTKYDAPLPPGVFGKSFFGKSKAEIYYNGKNNTKVVPVDKGTILVNPDVYNFRSFGAGNNTQVHECVHQYMHALFFELQKLLGVGEEYCAIDCKVDGEGEYAKGRLKETLKIIEWQADALTPRIQMPKKQAQRKFEEIMKKVRENHSDKREAVILQISVSKFADYYEVSKMSAKIRLYELGYTQVLGTYVYWNGISMEPYSFRQDALQNFETFELTEQGFHNLFVHCNSFRDIILNGLFIYVEGFVCIQDEKYILADEKGVYHLTDYARDHVDECCLVFHIKGKRGPEEFNDALETEFCLCRAVDASRFVEEEFDPYEEDNQNQTEKAKELQKIKKQAEEIANHADHIPSSFSGALEYHMQRKGITVWELEDQSGISNVTINQYLNKGNIRPGKTSVLALCVGLNLHPFLSLDLLKKAGHDIIAGLTEENAFYLYLITNHPMESREQWNEKCRIWGIPEIPTRNR